MCTTFYFCVYPTASSSPQIQFPLIIMQWVPFKHFTLRPFFPSGNHYSVFSVSTYFFLFDLVFSLVCFVCGFCLFFFILYMSEITWYFSFSDLFHLASNPHCHKWHNFIFLWQINCHTSTTLYKCVCVCVCYIFTHAHVNGHLGCFCILAVLNSVAWT